MRIHSYDNVKNEIELKNEYFLLSNTYKNCHEKLKIKCKNGHIFFQSFKRFKEGHKCKLCKYKEISKNKRFDLNFLKNYFKNIKFKLLSKEYLGILSILKIKCPNGHIIETNFFNFKKKREKCIECYNQSKLQKFNNFCKNKNYKLISPEYKGSSSKLKIQCTKGHIFEMAPGNILKNQNCPICSKKRRHTYLDVFNFLKNEDYELIDEEYTNSLKKLKMKCPNGHKLEMAFSNFQQGQRCRKCFYENRKLSTNYIKNILNEYNYELLSEKYINCMTKLDIKCPNGHIFKMTFNKFNLGRRCKKCFYEKNTGENHSRWNPNKKIISEIRMYRTKSWIEKNMKDDHNYYNFLSNKPKYHLDHIIPIFAFYEFIVNFNLDKKIIRKIANKKENLQLLTHEDNYKKHKKYKFDEVFNYILENYKGDLFCTL